MYGHSRNFVTWSFKLKTLWQRMAQMNSKVRNPGIWLNQSVGFIEPSGKEVLYQVTILSKTQILLAGRIALKKIGYQLICRLLTGGATRKIEA